MLTLIAYLSMSFADVGLFNEVNFTYPEATPTPKEEPEPKFERTPVNPDDEDDLYFDDPEDIV